VDPAFRAIGVRAASYSSARAGRYGVPDWSTVMRVLTTNTAATKKAHRPVALPANDPAMLLARARNAAFAEASKGNLGGGLGVLYDALQETPSSHDLLADMAALLLAAGKLEHAAAFAERALRLHSQHGPSLYTLGFALSGQGKVDRAIGVLTELQSGAGRDSLQADAPELVPVAMIELERLRRTR
jgi:tetratricopeptide (TPR) repeat protein